MDELNQERIASGHDECVGRRSCHLRVQICETYDIELPAGDDEAAEVFAAVAHEKYRTVGRTLGWGAETIQMLPVSPPAAEA